MNVASPLFETHGATCGARLGSPCLFWCLFFRSLRHDALQCRSGHSGAIQHLSPAHENSVHCFRMKNITLSADEDLIERARSIARGQRRTLNAAFREWLAQFAQSTGDAQGFDALMNQMQYVDAGGHFSRDDLNER
jgi:hypothetical protein